MIDNYKKYQNKKINQTDIIIQTMKNLIQLDSLNIRQDRNRLRKSD